MSIAQPSIDVYKHARKEVYLMLRNAPLGPGGVASTTFGDFVRIGGDDMRTKSLEIILADFQEYSCRDPKHGSVLHGFSPEAKKARRLLREYDKVVVYLESESVVGLGPVCVTGRSGDSGVVRKEDVLLVSLPCPSEVFFEKLLDAFGKCCHVENV